MNLPSDESFQDVLRKQVLDVRYIHEANWSLDLRIILMTALRMVGLATDRMLNLLGLNRRHFATADELAKLEKPEVPEEASTQSTPPSFAFAPEHDSGVLL